VLPHRAHAASGMMQLSASVRCWQFWHLKKRLRAFCGVSVCRFCLHSSRAVSSSRLHWASTAGNGHRGDWC